MDNAFGYELDDRSNTMTIYKTIYKNGTSDDIPLCEISDVKNDNEAYQIFLEEMNNRIGKDITQEEYEKLCEDVEYYCAPKSGEGRTFFQDERDDY